MTYENLHQPGTPEARFIELLNELENRFPDAEAYSAQAPEARYLAAIDAVIAKQPKLVHQVVLESWPHVARVLKFFKRRAHYGFFLEVEELYQETSYRVKVFKS